MDALHFLCAFTLYATGLLGKLTFRRLSRGGFMHKKDVSTRALRPGMGVIPKRTACLAAAIALLSQPALSQGAMGPGPGATPIAPAPRAAPAPVVAPQAPVIPIPSVTQPGLPKIDTPRGSTTTGSSSPAGSPTEPRSSASPGSSGTPPPTGEPAGLKGTTAVVALLALQTNNNSSAIFDRWGNLFAESKSNTPVPNFSIVSTDRARGSVSQTNTDPKGQFRVASTPGVHEITLPAKDIEAAYIKIVEILGDQSPEQAGLRGGFIIPLIAVIAFKVPGATTGGGQQEIGLARAIPRGAPTMQVKLAVNKDGAVSTVDWGDGAGPMDINREGKALGRAGPMAEITGRTLFVGDTTKK